MKESLMNKSMLSIVLCGALIATACQHDPAWQASEQRSQALAEAAIQETTSAIEEDEVQPAPQLPLTRVWFIPVAAVGGLGDDDLGAHIVELVATLGHWQHIERVEVIGHTDSLGSEQYNQRLSVQRADHVAERLIMAGIDEQLIAHVGEGELIPRADNETEQGRADNRRVEIRVTGLGPWSQDTELARTR
jgi:hypothetical protein